MIESFRVEISEPTKQKSIDNALQLSLAIFQWARAMGQLAGEWECTDDVTSQRNGDFLTRVKYIYHPTQHG